MYQRMINHADLGKYQMSIGTTIDSDPGPHLIEDAPKDNVTYMGDEDTYMGSQYYYHTIYDIYEGGVSREIELDKITVNFTHVRLFQGVDTTHI